MDLAANEKAVHADFFNGMVTLLLKENLLQTKIKLHYETQALEQQCYIASGYEYKYNNTAQVLIMYINK